jgi:uncharacterized protein YoxC
MSMSDIVFGGNNPTVKPVMANVNKQLPVSIMNLLTSANTLRPAYKPLPSQVGGATGAESALLAKNTQLQNDLNMVTTKYNNLVNKLRAAGMIH